MQTLIIDCSYLCHQARHVLKGLTFNHMDTNIIFGFMYRVLNLAKRFNTNRLAFAWDSKYNLRKEMFPAYKKRRKEKFLDDNEIKQLDIIIGQFDRIRSDVLPSIGFRHIIRQKGHEADDIMMSVVMNNPGRNVMVTADEDMYQSLDYCDIWKPSSKKMYTKKDLWKEYGISPSQWAEVKAMAGCSTDEVPGIKGIGNKTAAKIIAGVKNSGTKFEKAYSPEGREIIERNRPLVTLPLPSTKKFKLNFSKEKLSRMDFISTCSKYGMESFTNKGNLTTWAKLFQMK